MKKYAVLNFVVVFAVMFSACTKEMRNNLNELSSNNVSQLIDETKDEFLSLVTEDLKRAEVLLTELENEIKKKSEELSTDIRTNLEDLKKERTKLESQIGALKNISQENWEMTRESFTESMDVFKTEFNTFLDGLKTG